MEGPYLLTSACRARNGVLLLGLLGLGACADPAAAWQRPGTAETQRSADYRGCRDLARASSEEGAAQDIAATRAAQSFHTGGAAPPADTVAMDERAADRVLVDCMTEKGYRHD